MVMVELCVGVICCNCGVSEWWVGGESWTWIRIMVVRAVSGWL